MAASFFGATPKRGGMTTGQRDHEADEHPREGERGDYEEHRGEMGRAVGVGAAAGVVASVPMGLFLQFGTGILPVLGGFVGAPSLLGGWLMNVVMGIVHGIFFALVLAWPAVHRYVPIDAFADYTLSGLVYGTLVAMVTIAALPFVMDVLQALGRDAGVAGGPSNPAMVGLGASVVLSVGHLVYGVVLGAAYAILQGVGPGT